MSIEAMREQLGHLYNGAPKWKKKVAKMSDKQVIAVFYRMVAIGAIK